MKSPLLGSLRSCFGFVVATVMMGAACKSFRHLSQDLKADSVSMTSQSKVVCKDLEFNRSRATAAVRHQLCDVPVSAVSPMQTVSNTKGMHVLTFEGEFKDISYAHGYVLAKETDQGVMADMLPKAKAMLSDEPTRSIITCLTDRMYESVSQEFRDALDSFYAGYQQAAVDEGRTPLFTPDADGARAFRIIALGVELENVSDGITHRLMDHKLFEILSPVALASAAVDATAALKELSMKCKMEGLEALIKEGVAGVMEKLLPNGPNKFACTGFISPSQTSRDNQFVHARNLDSDSAQSWNNHPVLFLVKEKKRVGNGWHTPYASIGSAGMFFMGGVGGFNANGITVSLHQMYTRIYRIGESDSRADIAPFVTQKILRSANSISDARDIVSNSNPPGGSTPYEDKRGQKHFGAWAELVGDAKTNEVLSIELSGAEKLALNGVGVYEGKNPVGGNDAEPARQRRGEAIAQSNHFFSKVFDAAYVPFFNKYLESRSRFRVLQEELDKSKGKIDLEFALNVLSNHHDYYEGFRSFGRTIAKVYGAMSHIMIPNKRVSIGSAPEVSEVWVSVGERVRTDGYEGNVDLYLSSSQSTYVGFDINWNDLTATPIEPKAALRTTQFDSIPKWQASLPLYIQARHTYVNPPGKNETAEDAKRRSLKLLDQAIMMAESEGQGDIRMRDKPQIIYYFMRARLRHELGDFVGAVSDWERLWEFYKPFTEPFSNGALVREVQRHRAAYQAATIAMYSVISSVKANRTLALQVANERLTFAKKVFSEEGLNSAQRSDHFDLKRKLYITEKLLKNRENVPSKLQPLDFVFLE